MICQPNQILNAPMIMPTVRDHSPSFVGTRQYSFIHQMNSLPLNALLEFVDECDLSDASQQDCAPTRKGPSSSTPKQQSRNVREIASLQAQVASLTQQLKQVKETRSAGANLGLDQGSYWQDEAELQSRQRFAAQEENERLRDQLQALKQVAMRLVNMMKRRPSIRVRELVV